MIGGSVANAYLMDFYTESERRYNRDSADMTHGDWMCANTSLNKKPFSFDRYPFQKQIADDMHPNLDCIKPSQVGLTEIQIRKALAILSRMPNTSLIYTMPNERMFKRISKARIQPLLSYDKAFQLREGDKTKQSMDLMKIGTSFLYVTGSAEADATSINADFVFNDEIDLTDPSMLALFNSRLQGSDHRINQRFSTPTYEGFGVDKGFSRSDQHEYVIKCRSCNHHQVPVFNREFVHVPGMPDNIEKFIDLSDKLVDNGSVRIDQAVVLCEKCRKPLDLADYDNREWVAKYPSRVLNRGYRIRTFSTHRLDPVYVFTQMFKYKERDNLKGFHNTVLGEAYTNEDQKLTESVIKLAMGNSAAPEKPDLSEKHFLGVDVGSTCYIVVGAGQDPSSMRVIECLTCISDHLESVVARLDKKYNLEGGGLDRYPYTPTINKIRTASNGKLMPVHYHAGKEVAEELDPFKVVDYIKANRTAMIDYVANGIKAQRWHIEGYNEHRQAIVEHLQDMVREEEPEKQAVWIKLNGKDHFFHAMAYLATAVVYYEYLNGTSEHQNVNTEFSGSQENLNPFLVSAQQDIFGTTDLIGYSSSSVGPDKVIRRHS